MSRFPFSRFRIRPVTLRTRRSPDDPDRVLVGLCRHLDDTVRRLQVMLEADGRDADEIPGFVALADREAALIEKIAVLPARTLTGVVAKARGALLRPDIRGYDGAQILALSAAEDLVRLAAGPERPSSGDPSLPGQLLPKAARTLLVSDPDKVKEQNMNNSLDADHGSPVHGRDVARGAMIGLLGELGARSVVGGVALLLTRPDLPWPLPAALVLVGLGAVALAVACLRRMTRP